MTPTDQEKEIEKAFVGLGINLKKQPKLASAAKMFAGTTNRYIELESHHGAHYLLRLNGPLWPPFSRESEHDNLNQLVDHQIDSHVIFNHVKAGFQISRLMPDEYRSHRMRSLYPMLDIMRIGRQLKRLHVLCEFTGEYPVCQTMMASYGRLNAQFKIKYQHHYYLAVGLMSLLSRDVAHYVASHNDLLPSSVYIKDHDLSIVDWEYSGLNHRAYDLAFFSIKAGLSQVEERDLITGYSQDDLISCYSLQKVTGQDDEMEMMISQHHDELDALQYSILLMKPVIRFLLLSWSLGRDAPLPRSVLDRLDIDGQTSLFTQSGKTMWSEAYLRFFHIDQTAEDVAKEDPRVAAEIVLDKDCVV